MPETAGKEFVSSILRTGSGLPWWALGGVAKPAPPAAWNPGDESLRYWQPMDKFSGSGGSLTLLDQGPNSWDATVGGGTPAIVPGVLNGNPVLRLNGTTDYLSFAAGSVVMPIGSPSTVIIVAKGTLLTAGNFAALVTFATDTKYEGFLNINNVGYANMFWGGGNASTTSYVGINGFDYSSAFYALVVTYNGAGDFSAAGNFTALENNTPQTVSASGAVGTVASRSLIGAWPDALGALNYPGDIAEIIVASTVWDATTLGKLHTYLNTKYGMGIGAVVASKKKSHLWIQSALSFRTAIETVPPFKVRWGKVAATASGAAAAIGSLWYLLA